MISEFCSLTRQDWILSVRKAWREHIGVLELLMQFKLCATSNTSKDRVFSGIFYLSLHLHVSYTLNPACALCNC